jgi:hypothetical protein
MGWTSLLSVPNNGKRFSFLENLQIGFLFSECQVLLHPASVRYYFTQRVSGTPSASECQVLLHPASVRYSFIQRVSDTPSSRECQVLLHPESVRYSFIQRVSGTSSAVQGLLHECECVRLSHSTNRNCVILCMCVYFYVCVSEIRSQYKLWLCT